LRRIDRELKKRGYVAGAAQKAELARQKAGVGGGRWAVATQPERLWITPYRRAVMPKSFKERCRRAKVPPIVRGYLFEALASEELEALFSLLSS
ncbi:MAG: tRNA lysidine(34) synthetase TilS, partial [Epsilonproteobacteria bacterium]|nr:tRNA lysidine(34) synthetase TilS [Campylobacterota bacterium]